MAPDGGPREVEYFAKGNVLPVRHLLVLRDKDPTGFDSGCRTRKNSVPAWVQDYALFLLDVDGRSSPGMRGRNAFTATRAARSSANPCRSSIPTKMLCANFEEKLKRAAGEGHVGTEGWQLKKDGSRFWANVITMALKDEKGDLQGFARVVRDFTDRHERDEKLRRNRARIRPIPLNRPSRASSPANLTGFPKPTTRFSTWSGTPVKICRPAGCTGPI